MCGFAGLIVPGAGPASLGALVSMQQAVAHRGPDGRGILSGAALGGRWSWGLAHARLAIIDPSQASAQPMADPSGQVAIVLNGEIFNYQDLRREIALESGWVFRSRGDTEVVLAGYVLWGPGVLSRLNGMFALAIVDRRRGLEVVLARDRFGKKPLYLCREPSGEFLLASEWRGIRAGRRKALEVDPLGLVGVLTEYGTPVPLSIERDVQRLEAGTWAVWTPDGFSTERWYTPPVPSFQPAEHRRGELELEQTVESVLREAVASRMVADVPVAAFLSGGVDSAMVVALAQALSGRKLSTYTVGYGGDDDERGPARATAEALGTEHREVIVAASPGDVVAEGIGAMDEPTGDGAFFATVQLAKVVARDFKVVLTGEGSDEIFGGYGHYVREARWGWIFDVPLPLRRTTGKGLGSAAQRVGWRRLAELTRHFETEADRSGGRWAQAWSLNAALALLEDKARQEVIERYDQLFPARAFAPIARSIPSRPARAQWLDQVTLLPNYLLQKVDRATMAYGLEARTPYLDHRLAEILARYPWVSWATPIGQKSLLRRIAQDYLPREVVDRAKLGFSSPTRQWLDALVGGRGGVSRDDIASLSEYESKKLWVLAVLQLWLERWGGGELITGSPWHMLWPRERPRSGGLSACLS